MHRITSKETFLEFQRRLPGNLLMAWPSETRVAKLNVGNSLVSNHNTRGLAGGVAVCVGAAVEVFEVAGALCR